MQPPGGARGHELSEERATAQAVVPKFDDLDVTTFERQRGRLPAQREGDALDYRGLLHRDGSVISALSPSELKQLADGRLPTRLPSARL